MKIQKCMLLINVILCLQNYLIEQTPTESSVGVVLFYINKKNSSKTHPDL